MLINLDNHADFIKQGCKVKNNTELLKYLKKENSPKTKTVELFFKRLGHFLKSFSWVSERTLKKAYNPLNKQLESKLKAFEAKKGPFTKEEEKEIQELSHKISNLSALYLGTRFKTKLEDFMHVARWNKLTIPKPPEPPSESSDLSLDSNTTNAQEKLNEVLRKRRERNYKHEEDEVSDEEEINFDELMGNENEVPQKASKQKDDQNLIMAATQRAIEEVEKKGLV
ncbi:hypothetical protein [Parachlamydia sp. AcF125]|uniref:hypothetical protein n=1 Tax=Parachlamydia sp. AcF125 TaxID=2795736 RepID=UPI001BCA2A66|nr:hypothetical protein [Parachlamydia sp. AcF125]MBS4168357.1 hypothetical protein [Parachlamydia sp. AcF125]